MIMDTLTLKERYFSAIHSMREALKYYVSENGNSILFRMLRPD